MAKKWHIGWNLLKDDMEIKFRQRFAQSDPNTQYVT